MKVELVITDGSKKKIIHVNEVKIFKTLVTEVEGKKQEVRDFFYIFGGERKSEGLFLEADSKKLPSKDIEEIF